MNLAENTENHPSPSQQVLDERGVTAADGTTKARIERAALSLFVEQGVDATTTREIAAAAGVSEGALYRHFKSKEEIARTLFFAIHERLASLVWGAGVRATGIAAQAGIIVDAYCRTADEDWTLFCFHLLHAHHFLPRADTAANPETGVAKESGDNPVAAAEEIVRDAMDREEILKGDPALLAGMALGVVMQTALQIAYGRLQGPLGQYALALQEGVLAVLRPRAIGAASLGDR